MKLFQPRLLSTSFATLRCHKSIRCQQRLSRSPSISRGMSSLQWSAQYVTVPGNHEWAEDYLVGGYHPVHLSDVFKDRYCVLRKLGHGRYATVWLAEDIILSKHVALKICVASDDEEAQMEAKLLTDLQVDTAVSGNTRPPVTRIFDTFPLHGPNGNHLVMSLEPLGQTVQQLIQAITYRSGTDSAVKDVNGLRRISRQMIEAIQFIHSKGIVHRDVQPQNFMFELREPVSEILEMDEGEDARTYPLERVDGKPLDKHAPAYIVGSWPFYEDMIENSRLAKSRVVLTDFGAATTFDNANDGKYAYPLPLRSPEILLGLPTTEKSDIWALGCTVDAFEGPETRDDEHVQSMIEVLGPMPKRMTDFWKRRHLLIDEHGDLLPERVENLISDPLSTAISQFGPKYMSTEETAMFESFLRFVFQYEVDRRPSASELLQHPWVNIDMSNDRGLGCTVS